MRMENGSVAITADGVDQCLLNHRSGIMQKLITENSDGSAGGT
jgi:hypothetical protein